jgi:hypothetical protein
MPGLAPELPSTFLRREKLPSSTMGNLEGGSFTRDFERWMKGALEVERLSLRELYEGNLEEGLFYWGPRRIC